MRIRRIGISRKLLSLSLALTMVLGTVVSVHGETRVVKDPQITVINEGAWLETAYMEWEPVEGAVGYNAYVKPSSAENSAYRQLDDELIRQYPSYWRADALGLTAGEYMMKVEAIFEDDSKIDVATNSMGVEAHDRSGFAFSGDSTYKTGSGAYNDDGTLKEGAQVIYVTSETAKTVSLDVITSNKGKIEKGVGIAPILKLREKGADQTPLAIRFVGQVTEEDMGGQINSNGYLQVKGKPAYGEMNITFEGVGNDAYASGWGFLIRSCGNVEIRNMGIMLFPDDGVSLDTDNCNVWIHNNDFFYGRAGSDKDQAKGDGSADIKSGSTYVTFSYNHFWDAGKTSLCGMTGDTKEFFVSYHHNWFDHSDSRHPRIRRGTIHIYNNYFDGVSKYGVGTTMGSSAFVEANDFRNTKLPMLSSLQGTDALGHDIFSKETGGMIKAFNNNITEASSLIYANSDSGTALGNETEFDAYLAQTRDELVPNTYKTVFGGTTYNNFDTHKDLGVQVSAIDKVEDVRGIVTDNAGRLGGGDFTWEFDNSVDDTSYAVNQELMAKIRSYRTQLVSVGGGMISGPVDPVDPPTDPVNPPVSGESFTHNFTEDGLISDHFMFTGNLSDSKGTVTYNGLTLTQCLKMESRTDISFTTNKPSIVTLVFVEGGKKVDVNGNKKDYITTDEGMLVLELEAGTHTIKKGDTANLFYIEVAYEEENQPVDPEEPDLPVGQTSVVHNFTQDGKMSDYFTITGNLATDKGTVSYKGLTLTQCLKMETPTNISFSTTADSTLTLVFGIHKNRNIRVNGIKYTFDNDVFEMELPAGDHTITKADTINLFYMSVGSDGLIKPTDPVDPTEPTEPVKPTAPNIEDVTSMGTATNLFGQEDSYFTNAVYVGPNGTPGGNGEKDNPLDLISAIEAVKSLDGSAILLLDGRYEFDEQLNIDLENNGTAQSYKVLKASKGAEVILDFSGQSYSMKDMSLNARGIQLDGSYWYIEGMTIYGAADNGMMISGSHNIVENCVFDSNRDTGLQISRRNSSLSNFEDWPAYNHIINTTSKNNCDPATYENADGFAAKLTCGEGNVFDGCIAYNNSDDGWDLFAKTATGPIGVVTIKNSIAMRSGKTEEGITDPNCDGNGFKLGGSGVGTPHIVINSLAIENLYNGFTDNNNPSAIALKNVTAFDNNQGNKKNNFSVYRCKDAYIANAISYTENPKTSDKYVNLNAEYAILYNSSKWYKVEGLQAMDTGKSALRGSVLEKGVTASDFISSTVPPVGTDFHKLWRNADGTINTNGVGIISPDSDYATFSTDGGVIGARFSADNKTTVTQVSIDSSEIEIPGEDVEKPTQDVEIPQVSLNPGIYNSSQSIELFSQTDGATIYYTTNGDKPTRSSEEYTNSITISKTTTVKAIAVKEGMNDSDLGVFEYVINQPSITEVIVSPSKTSVKKGSSEQFKADLVGEYDADQSVTWTVAGASDSTITSNGLLEVGIEETAEELTVIATSDFDHSKEGRAKVRVTELPVTYHTVTIGAVPKEGGIVSGGGEIAKGGSANIFANANPGYIFAKWVDNDSQHEYTTSASISINVQSDRDFTAVFEPVTIEKIKIVAGPTTTNYTEGEPFNPKGMTVMATYSDGSVSEVTDYSYSPGGLLIASDSKVIISYGEATAEIAIRVNKVVESYRITASAGMGGTISPSGNVNVKEGDKKAFTIKANSGYYISDIIVDMKSIGGKTNYTFSDVIQDHTIRAIFKQYEEEEDENNAGTKEPTTPAVTPPVTKPKPVVVLEVISAKETSKDLDAAMVNGKIPSISVSKNGGTVEISKETSTKLKNSNNGLVIKGVSTQITLANDLIKQLSDTALSISVSNLVEESYEQVKTRVATEVDTRLIGDAM